MKLMYIIGLVILLASSTTLADSNNCSVILTQTSNNWANQKSSTPDIEKALSQYGNCVDQDTQQLHTTMLKTNNYPLMGANGDFQDFSAALNNFTEIALKLKQDKILSAYAHLYQKQFKLLFYADYINNSTDPLIKRLKTIKPPSLEEVKANFEETLKTFPPKQQKELLQAFTPLITQSEFGKTHQRSVYLYAYSVIEPPSGTAYPGPF